MPPTHWASAASSEASAGSGSDAVPAQPAGRSDACRAIAVSCGVAGGPATTGELAAAGELTGTEGAALLTVAAGALLVAAALTPGAADPELDGEAAGLDDAACGLELLLHPAIARDTESVTATDDQILKRDNCDISQE